MVSSMLNEAASTAVSFSPYLKKASRSAADNIELPLSGSVRSILSLLAEQPMSKSVIAANMAVIIVFFIYPAPLHRPENGHYAFRGTHAVHRGTYYSSGVARSLAYGV